MKVIIVGHGPGGMTTSCTLRVWDRKAEIVNIDTKDFDLYHPCATPYVIGGKFCDDGDEKAICEDIPYDKMRVSHLKRHLVETIDRENKKVHIRNLDTDEEFDEDYDKLVLATGSYPTKPPIKGIDADNVFTLKWLEDAEQIRKAAENAKKVVIIGASAIALEVGCELAERDIDVTIMVRSRVLRTAVDKDFSKTIVDILDAEFDNLTFKVGSNAKEIIKDENNKAVKVITTEDEEIETDFIFTAAGVRQEVSLAKEAGLEIGETGGVKVDKYLYTSDPDILAIGDCTETIDLVKKKPISSMLATCAVRMGRVAAMSIAKPKEIVFTGTADNFIVPLSDLQVGSVGYTSIKAKEQGFNVLAQKIKTTDKPSYMPGAREVYFKIIVDRDTGKVLGGQGIGYRNIADNLNIVSLAIQADMDFKELLEADLCYAPAINETIYPVTQALEMIARRILR